METLMRGKKLLKNRELTRSRKLSILKLAVFVLSITLMLQGCGQKLAQYEKNPEPGVQQAGSTTAEPGATLPDEKTDDSGDAEDNTNKSGGTGNGSGQEDDTNESSPPAIDFNEVKPDESGKIMVVMFHNFIEEYKKGDKLYTTTFDAFEQLLNSLYEMDYRLISLNDYLNGHIDVPAGCIPMVFTFDDGTSGQFNLIEEEGKLKVNPRSAVGIMEKFNETHPDFGVKGTFYVNLGNQTFGGAGTLAQRLEYLIDKGFEIGNHTYSHINLKKDAKTAEIIQKEIGGNQKKMYELIPGYTFTTFSLPYGAPSATLMQYVIKGEYEGVRYENKAIMEVGWDPNPSPFSAKFDPLAVHRVRSSGIEPVEADLEWWLKNLKRSSQFVSDGNPDTVTVPEEKAEAIDKSKLGGRTLVTY